MIWKNNSMKKYKVKRKTKIQINALVTRFNCYEDCLLKIRGNIFKNKYYPWI